MPSRPATGCCISATRGTSGDRKRGGAGRSGSTREGDVDRKRGGAGRSGSTREGDADRKRGGADRADQLRTDVDAATAGWAEAGLLRVDSRNQVMIVDGRVALQSAVALADKPPPEAVFLGRIDGDRHVWAIRSALEPPEDL